MRKDLYYVLDNSGSIDSNNRLAALNSAMYALCNNLKNFQENHTVDLTVTVLTFKDVGNREVLTTVLEDVPPEFLSSAWADIQPDVIEGGTPLGQALIDLSELMANKNKVNMDLGDDTAAPGVVILSDGIPTVRDGEYGRCIAQSLESLTNDVEQAKSICFDFARSVRAVVALGIDRGSKEEELLFSLAHGSKTISVEDLRFHASDDSEDLLRALWSATLGTIH